MNCDKGVQFCKLHDGEKKRVKKVWSVMIIFEKVIGQRNLIIIRIVEFKEEGLKSKKKIALKNQFLSLF